MRFHFPQQDCSFLYLLVQPPPHSQWQLHHQILPRHFGNYILGFVQSRCARFGHSASSDRLHDEQTTPSFST